MPKLTLNSICAVVNLTLSAFTENALSILSLITGLLSLAWLIFQLAEKLHNVAKSDKMTQEEKEEIADLLKQIGQQLDKSAAEEADKNKKRKD